MKHTKFFILALVAAMTFSACGTDDSLEITKLIRETVVIMVAKILAVVLAVVQAANQPISTIQTRMWLQSTCLKW